MKVHQKAVPRLHNKLKQRFGEKKIEPNLDAGVTLMMNGAQDAKKRQLINFKL
jgi:hypothetical protein